MREPFLFKRGDRVQVYEPCHTFNGATGTIEDAPVGVGWSGYRPLIPGILDLLFSIGLNSTKYNATHPPRVPLLPASISSHRYVNISQTKALPGGHADLFTHAGGFCRRLVPMGSWILRSSVLSCGQRLQLP